MIFSCGTRQLRVADAVGGHLQQVLEQGDAPADERGNEPRLRAELLQMRVPRERHEDVRQNQQDHGLRDDGHESSYLVVR